MGDLDELLSEIDAIDRGDFTRTGAPQRGGRGRPSPAPTAANQVPPRGISDKKTKGDMLDDLLEELGDICTSQAPSRSQPPNDLRKGAHSGSSLVSRTRTKCAAVILGPQGSVWGRSSGVDGVVCCDNLRCTRCDFKVLRFDGVAWHGDVDYMFFRNCYPDEEKMRGKLRGRAGSSAYACQCQWVSCLEEMRVDYSADLRWVCAGHTSYI